MKAKMGMRSLLMGVLGTVIVSIGGMPASLSAQEAGLVVVDPAVARSAQAAVQKMGLEMMKGNFGYAHTRMYPRWKRRLAKQHGGMAKLEAGLAQAVRQQAKMGMMVTAFHAGTPTSFFSVWRAKKRDDKGELVKDATGRFIVVEHWLTFVPTVTRVKIPDTQRGGKLRTLEERSYTVAITEKGKNDWYFMTGMKPTIQDLRSMFPSLPATKKDLKLPPSSAREIK